MGMLPLEYFKADLRLCSGESPCSTIKYILARTRNIKREIQAHVYDKLLIVKERC